MKLLKIFIFGLMVILISRFVYSQWVWEVTVYPESSTVCPGTQTSSTVTAYVDNPYQVSTTVDFSCSAPSGITCSFNQFPGSSSYQCTTSGYSCSATLFITSSSSAHPGSYSVTVTASDNGSASATYEYIIPAPSISSIQLNPSSSSPVCPGTQTSSTVTANLSNPCGFSTTVDFSCSAPSGITCSVSPSSCTTSGSSCSTTLYVNSSLSTPPGSYSVTVTASDNGSASATYTYNIGQQISISSQQSSNFQNSYNIYITGCSQNYTLYVNNSPYCYDLYYQFQNISALCTVSYPGSYSVYAQGCYNGTCVNSNTINLNIPSSMVPIIDINILNATNQNINTTISVNGSNQNIQSINVYYNNNNVYSNSNVNTNYYSFNLNLSYSNNGNITACSTLTNGQSNCVLQLLYFDIIKIVTYYGIIVG